MGGDAARVAGRWLTALALGSFLALAATSAGAQEGSMGYADLVARLIPSVVNITVEKATPAGNSANQSGAGRTPESSATFYGSGFIIDPSGYILTNRHVVIGSYSIVVTLSDGTRLVAHVVGHPPAIDIALLKVNADHPLPAVEFGDSDKVRVGDRVIAIGNPLGVGETVTSGIVSALNRSIQESPYDEFIQTDASINPGNSGGALFNLQGQVIGVNTALFTGGKAGSIGLGLAIPIDDAKFAATELREFGQVRPGWIGARLQQITPDLAAAFGLTGTGGALVATVDSSGPAEAAGLRPGDVIEKFNGSVPTDVRALMRMIAKSPIDSNATLTVARGGVDREVAVTIREYPPAKMEAEFPFELSKPPIASGDLGLRLTSIAAATRTHFKLPETVSGVQVAAVLPDSIADRAGLHPGDVILQVGDRPAISPNDVQQDLQLAAQKNRAKVGLLVVGPSGARWVPMAVGSAQ